MSSKNQQAILLSAFDRRKGPLPLYSKGLNPTEAQTIAFRSQMTLSMMDSAKIDSAEAILPLTDLGKIIFIYLFMIPQQDPNEPLCVAALSYILPQSSQMFLYSKVPFLKMKAEALANQIRSNYTYSEGTKLPTSIIENISKWSVSDDESTAEIQIVEKKVVISEKKGMGSVSLFLSQIKKNEDRLFYSILKGEKPILVTGSPDLVDYIIQSIELFVPYMTLRKINWTKNYVNPDAADIIGVPKELIKHYPKETLLVNIDKNRIEGGKNNNYWKSIIKEMRKDNLIVLDIINKTSEDLLKVSSALVEMYQFEEHEREERLNKLQKETNSDLFQLAVEFAAQRNPLIRELLLERLSQRFSDWMNGL